MRTIGRSKLIKSFIAITIVVITVATTYFIAMQFDKQPANPPDNGKATPDDTIIDDIDGNEKPTEEDKPVTIDVMSLDNTTVNWSHEYPASFVRDYNGYWNTSPSKLYLTFDCGYDYNNLASTIMDILKSKGIKAVFFGLVTLWRTGQI